MSVHASDALTGLPGRQQLADAITRALVRSGSKGVALLVVDLDRFLEVNQSLGFEAGDRLLRAVAHRLAEQLPPEALLARSTGDAFAVLCAPGTQVNDAAFLAQSMLDAMSVPFQIDHNELQVSASIGVTLGPVQSTHPEELLAQAQLALRRARADGRRVFRFWSDEMTLRARSDRSLQHDLAGALARNELALHYQPQVSIADGRIIGAEALMRWTHPRRGVVSPVEFIPVAEESGLILQIGAWALREAAQQARLWELAALPEVRVAVNISGVQLMRQDMVQSVARILDDTGLSPERYEIELTESTLMDGGGGSIEIMHKLRALGCPLAIDDFGTGYSSLSYLKRFPVEKLKIDRSFVMHLESDPSDAAIVRTIVGLCRSLGLKVIAEGVETEAQLGFLRELGCDEAQGYYFARPMPPAQFVKALSRRSIVPTPPSIPAPGRKSLRARRRSR